MKKIFLYLCLLLLFCNQSFAKNNTKLNDYLKKGYKIIEVDTGGKLNQVRYYTLKRGNNIVLCQVWINSERGMTNCYAP